MTFTNLCPQFYENIAGVESSPLLTASMVMSGRLGRVSFLKSSPTILILLRTVGVPLCGERDGGDWSVHEGWKGNWPKSRLNTKWRRCQQAVKDFGGSRDTLTFFKGSIGFVDVLVDRKIYPVGVMKRFEVQVRHYRLFQPHIGTVGMMITRGGWGLALSGRRGSHLCAFQRSGLEGRFAPRMCVRGVFIVVLKLSFGQRLVDLIPGSGSACVGSSQSILHLSFHRPLVKSR